MTTHTDRLGTALAGRYRIERRPSVVVHPPERWLAIDLPGGAGGDNWDLHPDGKRIVVVVNAQSTRPSTNTTPAAVTKSRYVIVQNWFTDLKRLTSRTKQ